MKAATAGGPPNPLRRRRARDQLLASAVAGKLSTMDLSSILRGQRQLKGSKSIRKNPKVG